MIRPGHQSSARPAACSGVASIRMPAARAPIVPPRIVPTAM